MPRQPRVTSGTDIYHVMLRGINRQDIFEDQEDYVRFLLCMQQMLEPYDDLGNRQPPLCTFYAYCLKSVSEYPWSSWGEYTGSVPPALSLCATNVVLKRMPLADLQELVDALLSDDVMILDIDDNPRVTIGDHEVRQYLLDHFQISKPLNIQALDKEQRNQILLFLLDLGAGFRQISRITGVPYGVIHRLSSKR